MSDGTFDQSLRVICLLLSCNFFHSCVTEEAVLLDLFLRVDGVSRFFFLAINVMSYKDSDVAIQAN